MCLSLRDFFIFKPGILVCDAIVQSFDQNLLSFLGLWLVCSMVRSFYTKARSFHSIVR